MTNPDRGQGRARRIVDRILTGASDRNIRFDDLRLVLRALRFEERVRGSHHIYSRDGVAEIINLQPAGNGMAKPYQVRQVRGTIVRYKLVGDGEYER